MNKAKKRKEQLIDAIKSGNPKKIARATCRCLAVDEKALKELADDFLAIANNQ